MAQNSNQIQVQSQQQLQTLSPLQILVVKMLELPTVELEDRVKPGHTTVTCTPWGFRYPHKASPQAFTQAFDAE